METNGALAQLIFSFLYAWQLPEVFVGSFIFGETVIITAAFLAGQGTWNAPGVFVMAFLGTVASDTLWFVAGRHFFATLKRRTWIARRYESVTERITAITGRRSFFLFIMIKFLYGTRIFMITHIASHKFTLGRFLGLDAAATALWLIVIFAVGWLAGRGALSLSASLGNLRAGVLVIAALLIVYKLFTLWLHRTIVTPSDRS